MLQLTAGVACLIGVALVAVMAVMYIAVGECDIIYRMGEVATFAFLATFGFAMVAAMEQAEAMEDEDESV